MVNQNMNQLLYQKVTKKEKQQQQQQQLKYIEISWNIYVWFNSVFLGTGPKTSSPFSFSGLRVGSRHEADAAHGVLKLVSFADAAIGDHLEPQGRCFFSKLQPYGHQNSSHPFFFFVICIHPNTIKDNNLWFQSLGFECVEAIYSNSSAPIDFDSVLQDTLFFPKSAPR